MTERGVEQHSGLPAEMSSLVGRRPQIAAVLDSLRAARVVTLTGPGGCGKTRLALRAATLAAGGFEDGARLVELASLTDQERKILEHVAQGLTNREIAAQMFLAEKTVKNYVSSLLAKLGLERRTQAAVLAT